MTRLRRLARIIKYSVDAAMCSVAPQLAQRAASYVDVKPVGWNLLFSRYGLCGRRVVAGVPTSHVFTVADKRPNYRGSGGAVHQL